MSDDRNQYERDNEPDHYQSEMRPTYLRERMSRDYQGPPRPADDQSFLQKFIKSLSSDSDTKKLVYGTVGLGGLLLVSIGGWALLGHHQSGVPVIGPPSVAMRTKPVDPGGMQLDNMIVPEADDGQAHLAPAPEKPDPGGLTAQYQGADATGKPSGADKSAPQPALAQNGEKDGVAAAPPAPSAAPEAPAPDSQDPIIQPDALAAGKVAEVPADAKKTEDDDEAETDKADAPAPVPDKPANTVAVNKATEKKPAIARQSVPRVSSGGKYQVQLAALQSSAQAAKEWERLQSHYSTLFAGRKQSIEKVQRDNAVFYRLRVTGFASTSETRAFCSAVRERGLACTQVR